MRYRVLLALLALALLLVPVAQADILWRGDYNTGNLSQWSSLQAKSSSRVTVVTTPVREGSHAARFEVRSGDNNVAGSGNGERAEVLQTNTIVKGAEGKEQWWAWATRFETAPVSNSAWNIWTQFHHTGSTGQSNVHFDILNKNQLRLLVNNGNPASPTSRSWNLAPLQLNKWYEVIFHVKWSSNPSVGFVEAWLDGANVVPKTNLATIYPGQGTYLKQGYYRVAQSNTMVLQHDGMRLGESFADVTGGGQPPPEPGPPVSGPESNIKEGDTLIGVVPWSLTLPGGTTQAEFWYKISGQPDVRVFVDNELPWEYQLDTRLLPNGQVHLGTAYTSQDGTRIKWQVGFVDIANTQPTPPPTPAPPPEPPPVPTPEPPATCDQACVDAYESRIATLESQVASLTAKIQAAIALLLE